jgi:hypothetical protein
MPFQQFAFPLLPFQLWLPKGGNLASKPPPMMRIGPVISWFVFFVSAPLAVSQNPNPPNPIQASGQTPAQRENYDPLLDPPPLPEGQVTLIGGTIISLDEIMNRMVVEPFGSKQKLHLAFDTRTHFFRDTKPVSEREIRQGERIYVDTMLNGSKVFAKTIWIQSSADSGMGRGQILDYDVEHRTLTIRDELSSQPLKMQVTPSTIFEEGSRRASSQELVRGTLVAVTFGPQRELRQVTLLARPGSTFTFAGRITYLDLSQKTIAVDNNSDRKKYDISIAAIPPNLVRQLHEGSQIAVSTVFDGEHYNARKIDLLNSNPATQP